MLVFFLVDKMNVIFNVFSICRWTLSYFLVGIECKFSFSNFLSVPYCDMIFYANWLDFGNTIFVRLVLMNFSLIWYVDKFDVMIF